MMPNAWSQEAPATIVTLVDTILTAATVFGGRALPGSVAPFACCWQLEPQQWGAGLAVESWGLAQAVWQVSCHGTDQGQARYMVEQLTGYASWPAGWELVEIGPCLNDMTDKPETWFIPVTFVYRGMV
jgi:hypothetical protein